MPTVIDPFPAEALPSNRNGQLSDDQARTLAAVARARAARIRWGAWVPAAIGLILLLVNGPGAPIETRHALGVVALAIAGVMLIAAGWTPLAADARHGQVDVVEGAIGKHRMQSVRRASHTRYFLDVAGQRLRTSRLGSENAPDAGRVRVYYLPRSKRVVNLEALPDRPVTTDAGHARGLVSEMAGALRAHDRTAIAEARADVAAFANAVTGASASGAAIGPGGGGSPLTAEAITGSWTIGFMTVTFAPNGTATLTTLGGSTRTGHWSIDAGGRLLTDATGTMTPTDARVEGDRLSIAMDGRHLTFTRTGGR